MSPAQLVWVHDGFKARQVRSEIRWLLNATAAVNTGTNGGEAAKARLEELQRELDGTERGSKNAETKSQMPLNRDDFDRMMAEANRKS